MQEADAWKCKVTFVQGIADALVAIEVEQTFFLDHM